RPGRAGGGPDDRAHRLRTRADHRGADPPQPRRGRSVGTSRRLRRALRRRARRAAGGRGPRLCVTRHQVRRVGSIRGRRRRRPDRRRRRRAHPSCARSCIPLSVPLSILDLVSISEGSTASDAIAASMETAGLAERLGYHRIWFAEHHNTPTLAASATSLLISQAASVTERIRLGSGGVMLPNHAPLMVAEHYGTLANMHGDRIDLGLGRAPGTDGMTAQALGRSSAEPQAFAQHIFDMQGWFGETGTAHSSPIQSAVSLGTRVPVWVLGSTVNGASIAGQLGLPFSLASHFAPDQIDAAVQVYRDSF